LATVVLGPLWLEAPLKPIARCEAAILSIRKVHADCIRIVRTYQQTGISSHLVVDSEVNRPLKIPTATVAHLLVSGESTAKDALKEELGGTQSALGVICSSSNARSARGGGFLTTSLSVIIPAISPI